MNSYDNVDIGYVRSLYRKARANKRVQYYKGYLYTDRMSNRDLDRAARYLLARALQGECHLLQIRHGDFSYSYFFVKR